MDWGEGNYECIGAGLLPAAHAVVDAAAPVRGESLVDIGCGDGNAALLASARGARVTGIDPSRSLIESATRRAAERSLDATFLEGTAAAMPLPDASADVIVSVFGVIFAPDAEAAAREMARVAAPVSRIVLAAWHPYGALADVSGMRREALAAALGAPPASPPLFVWDDESSVRELFEPFGFAVSIAEANLAFTASTVDAFAETEFRNHPAWLEAERVLDAPALATLLGRVTQLFIDANEDPDAFRLTSDYAIVTLRRT